MCARPHPHAPRDKPSGYPAHKLTTAPGPCPAGPWDCAKRWPPLGAVCEIRASKWGRPALFSNWLAISRATVRLPLPSSPTRTRSVPLGALRLSVHALGRSADGRASRKVGHSCCYLSISLRQKGNRNITRVESSRGCCTRSLVEAYGRWQRTAVIVLDVARKFFSELSVLSALERARPRQPPYLHHHLTRPRKKRKSAEEVEAEDDVDA